MDGTGSPVLAVEDLDRRAPLHGRLMLRFAVHVVLMVLLLALLPAGVASAAATAPAPPHLLQPLPANPRRMATARCLGRPWNGPTTVRRAIRNG